MWHLAQISGDFKRNAAVVDDLPAHDVVMRLGEPPRDAIRLLERRDAEGNLVFRVNEAGIFDADTARNPGTDTSGMYFHFKYLYEGTGQRLGAGTYWVEIENGETVMMR